MCVQNTNILSQIECVYMCMSELKEKVGLYLHISVSVCICLCPRMYKFSANSLTVVYISRSSGVNLSCRDVPVCWSVGLSFLN